jgi:hypothetical protein
MQKIVLSILTLAILTFVACNKDNNVTPTNDTTELVTVSSEDMSELESTTQSTEDELDDVLEENGLTVRGCKPTIALRYISTNDYFDL